MYLAPKKEVVIVLDRAMVELLDVGPAVDNLRLISVTREMARKSANALTLIVDGYDSVSLELYEIPAVRTFIRRLTEEWPYWFHFVNKTDHNLVMIMNCLMEIGSTSHHAGMVTSIPAEGEFGRVLMGLFCGMNHLHYELGFTKEENSAMTQEIVRYIESLAPLT